MKIFLSILLLSISFIGIAQANQLLINNQLEKLKNAKSYTLSMVEKLPEENYDFKPVKEEMSFKEQLVH